MKITDTDSLRAELEQFSPEQQREKTQQETQNTLRLSTVSWFPCVNFLAKSRN